MPGIPTNTPIIPFQSSAPAWGGTIGPLPAALSGGSGSWLSNLWGGMSPDAQAALVSTGLGGVGAYFANRGNRQQQEQDRALNAQQLQQNQRTSALQMLQRFLESDQSQQNSQQELELRRMLEGLAATQLDPLAQQRSRQRNALMANLLGGARNINVQAPAGIPMGQVSGGLRIPEGGFGQDVMGFFSPEARANAEGSFQSALAGVNPRIPTTDLSKVGYGAAGASPFQNAETVRQTQLTQNQADRDSAQNASGPLREAIMQALMQDVQNGGAQNAPGATPGAAPGAQSPPRSGGSNLARNLSRGASLGSAGLGIAAAAGASLPGWLTAALPFLGFLSDENLKEDIEPVEGTMMDRVEKLPISTWRYKGDSTPHIGPMAQDMQKSFGIGDGHMIPVVDAVGLMLQVNKELAKKVRVLERRIR